MDLGLTSKAVLVTGSTAGIGYATARLFAREYLSSTVASATTGASVRVDGGVVRSIG